MEKYTNPRGMGFVLYNSYPSYEDAYSNIIDIPLSQFIIINNVEDSQEHGKIYQKKNFNTLKYITRVCGPIPSVYPENVTLDYFNVSTDIFNDLNINVNAETNTLTEYLKGVIDRLSQI